MRPPTNVQPEITSVLVEKKIPVAMKNSPYSFTRELPWQSIEIMRLFSLEIHDFQPISENFPAKSLLAGNFQTEHGSLWTASTTSLFPSNRLTFPHAEECRDVRGLPGVRAERSKTEQANRLHFRRSTGPLLCSPFPVTFLGEGHSAAPGRLPRPLSHAARLNPSNLRWASQSRGRSASR